MADLGAPQQHRQPSRKGKKAWRKNVNVTEVQEGLENLRNEIISGGLVSEKKPEELFALDAVGSQDITRKYNLRKPLKVDEILAHRSAVPAIDTRKRGLSDLGDGIYEPAGKKHRGDWVSKKEVQRLIKSINKTSHLDESQSIPDGGSSFDLWSAESPNPVHSNFEYVPRARTKVRPETITRAPISMMATGKPTHAVDNPNPGTSYNPAFEDWEELLRREGDKEVLAERKRLETAELDAERAARIAKIAADDAEGRTDDESAWEGFESENEKLDVLRQKRPTRKTPAERNKAKRKKEASRLEKHERNSAKRGARQLEQLLSSQSLEGQEGVVDVVGAENIEEKSPDDSKIRRRKMGNVSVPEKSLEVVLPDELQDSLRLLKPEGNLLQDRFRNLLVNGKVESRKPVLQPKKRKVKYTEKWSHKDFGISV